MLSILRFISLLSSLATPLSNLLSLYSTFLLINAKIVLVALIISNLLYKTEIGKNDFFVTRDISEDIEEEAEKLELNISVSKIDKDERTNNAAIKAVKKASEDAYS